MRNYDAPTLAQLGGRGALVPHRLVWIAARNRATGVTEALGLWTGEYDLAVTLEGQARTYQGVAGLLDMDPITATAGLAVRVHQLRLAAIAPEVEDLVKGYDTRFAPVEVHRALLDPTTRVVAGMPHRVFRGMVNSIDFPAAEAGGSPACVVEVVSETRALTRTLASKKSDGSQQRRGGDRFRRYGDISGAVPVYWGELRAAAPADPAPRPPAAGGAAGGQDQGGGR